MRIRVLGSAAGGGFPQWNCGCANCSGVRDGTLRASPRTQACVAISACGNEWVLLGCSPEVRAQIESFPPLHPRGCRESPIAAVALSNGDLDHVLGLLSLRESQPLRLFATATVRRGLEQNVILRTLERFPGQVTWTDLTPGAETRIGAFAVVAVPVPGKVPLHLEGLVPPCAEDNVGLLVKGDRTLGWFPTVGGPTPELLRALSECDVVLFDGTFWSDDELERAVKQPARVGESPRGAHRAPQGNVGLGRTLAANGDGAGERSARDMAHWPVGGPGGSLELLAALPARTKVLVHLNNTNPLLDDDGPERASVTAAGVLVGHDGMELDA